MGMDRPRSLEGFRFVGDKRSQVVYDLDEIGDESVDSYVKLRMNDWLSYASHLTDWEREHTLDC